MTRSPFLKRLERVRALKKADGSPSAIKKRNSDVYPSIITCKPSLYCICGICSFSVMWPLIFLWYLMKISKLMLSQRGQLSSHFALTRLKEISSCIIIFRIKRKKIVLCWQNFTEFVHFLLTQPPTQLSSESGEFLLRPPKKLLYWLLCPVLRCSWFILSVNGKISWNSVFDMETDRLGATTNWNLTQSRSYIPGCVGVNLNLEHRCKWFPWTDGSVFSKLPLHAFKLRKWPHVEVLWTFLSVSSHKVLSNYNNLSHCHNN